MKESKEDRYLDDELEDVLPSGSCVYLTLAIRKLYGSSVERLKGKFTTSYSSGYGKQCLKFMSSVCEYSILLENIYEFKALGRDIFIIFKNGDKLSLKIL